MSLAEHLPPTTLAEAREAARLLGGEAATVVRRSLDALPAEQSATPKNGAYRLGPRPLELAVADRRDELLMGIHRHENVLAMPVPEAWRQELAAFNWLLGLLRTPGQHKR
jgi:hypothetical protein